MAFNVLIALPAVAGLVLLLPFFELREVTPAVWRLTAATGVEADCLFLTLMIRHHEGAIPMAEALLELGTDPRALEVATAIENGQTAEIDAMRSIQERLGCTA